MGSRPRSTKKKCMDTTLAHMLNPNMGFYRLAAMAMSRTCGHETGKGYDERGPIGLGEPADRLDPWQRSAMRGQRFACGSVPAITPDRVVNAPQSERRRKCDV